MTTESTRPRWRRRVLALGLSLLFAFLAAEILVRVVVGAPLAERLPIMFMQPNAHRGWEMVPGETHYTYHHPVHVNALGLRGPELGPKAEGEVRVLALGDSLVYGQGVGDEETLPFFLEEALTREDPVQRPWTVVNAGHRAYDTRQELALLEELGDTIEPDLVLLLWFWNDLKERDIQKTFTGLTKRGRVAFDTGDRVEGGSWWRWQARQLVRRSALVMFVYDMWDRPAPDTPLMTKKMITGGFERLGGYLDRFQAVAARKGLRLVVAVIPDANSLTNEQHQSRTFDERALELTEERELPRVDLRPPLLELYDDAGRLPVIPYDGHYLPEGNRVMAEHLAERILDLWGS